MFDSVLSSVVQAIYLSFKQINNFIFVEQFQEMYTLLIYEFCKKAEE